MFEIYWTAPAKETYLRLKNEAAQDKRYKAVKKAIELLAANPRHPSLETHEFTSLKGPEGEKVFEAYAENNTPAAYRIFWYYGPVKDHITVIAVTPHP